MVTVALEVTVHHNLDPAKARTFTTDAEMPALPPNLSQTRFKVIPGALNDLEELRLTWNHLRHMYIIDGDLSTLSEMEYAKSIDALLSRGWEEVRPEDRLHEDLLS